MAGKSKIETALSAIELKDFVKELAETPNLTNEKIQELAAARGVQISIMSAQRFKASKYADYLESIASARDFALQIEQIDGAESASTLADAGASALMEALFKFIVKTNTEGEVDLKQLSKIIPLVSKLRSGDHRMKALHAKLKEFERKEAEYQRKEKEREARKAEVLQDLKSRGGLSAESLAVFEAGMKLF